MTFRIYVMFASCDAGKSGVKVSSLDYDISCSFARSFRPKQAHRHASKALGCLSWRLLLTTNVGPNQGRFDKSVCQYLSSNAMHDGVSLQLPCFFLWVVLNLSIQEPYNLFATTRALFNQTLRQHPPSRFPQTVGQVQDSKNCFQPLDHVFVESSIFAECVCRWDGGACWQKNQGYSTTFPVGWKG